MFKGLIRKNFLVKKLDFRDDIPEEYREAWKLVDIERISKGWCYRFIINCYDYEIEAESDFDLIVGMLKDQHLMKETGASEGDIKEMVDDYRDQMEDDYSPDIAKLFRAVDVKIEEDDISEEDFETYLCDFDIWPHLQMNLDYEPGGIVSSEPAVQEIDDDEYKISRIAQDRMDVKKGVIHDYIVWNREKDGKDFVIPTRIHEKEKCKVGVWGDRRSDGRLNFRVFLGVLMDFYSEYVNRIPWRVYRMLYLLASRFEFDARQRTVFFSDRTKKVRIKIGTIKVKDIISDWLVFCHSMFYYEDKKGFTDEEWRYWVNVVRHVGSYYDDGVAFSDLVYYAGCDFKEIVNSVDWTWLDMNTSEEDRDVYGDYYEVLSSLKVMRLTLSSVVSLQFVSCSFDNICVDRVYVASSVYSHVMRIQAKKNVSKYGLMRPLKSFLEREIPDLGPYVYIVFGNYHKEVFFEC